MASFYTMQWTGQGLSMLDQRRLPHEERYLTLTTVRQVADAISNMTVRGAPAIGCAAAYGFYIGLERSRWETPEAMEKAAARTRAELINTRPTAVNLEWALNRVGAKLRALAGKPRERILKALLAEAISIQKADVAANKRMGEYGAELVRPGFNILTHCNAGALATGGFGTALGVIRAAHKRKRRIHVWVDETRPRLQGARLTAWELQREGIPCTLISDNTAGALMAAGEVDMVVTGADRIAANGDAANKIGTYPLAVLAHVNKVPFYIAAPESTFDRSINAGRDIPIERRGEEEVLLVERRLITAGKVRALNIAFDVTPARYISGFITERGVIAPPYKTGIAKAFAG